MTEWPFDIWLRAAVTNFGIPPSEFWVMSLHDWLVLTGDHPPALSRASLEQLMEIYPDE